MPRQTVAAVIPTKNCEKLMTGILDSLWFCDEVIVVDMFSTDQTRKICESYPNVRFFERQDYIYANFNYGMDQAKSQWIMRLDSDERLSIELQDEIMALLDAEPDRTVYTAPYRSYFLGKPIHHGTSMVQTHRITLFRKGTLRYVTRSEHEDLTPTNKGPMPPIGRLQGLYLHFSVPSITKYLKKIDYYSERDIERCDPNEITVRPPWRVGISTLRYFYRNYVRYQGYKDGYHGFTLCALDAFYMLINQLKEWERKEEIKKLHDRVRDEFDAKVHQHRLSRQRR